MSQVDVPYTSQRLRFVVEPALADEIHGGTTACTSTRNGMMAYGLAA